MSRITRRFVILGLLLTVAGGVASVNATAQEPETVLDLADVPLPVDHLPEAGYQVLAGGYLDLETAATWIADPRVMSSSAVMDELEDAGWLQAYVLDLVLLQDRAFAESDILALVQTNVFLLPDESGAERVYELMADYSRSEDAEDAEPAAVDSTTVRLVSQSGDTMRTVFQRGRTVIEVVTLEGFDSVDPEMHRSLVIDTLDRLEALQDSAGPGISARAVRLVDGDNLADFMNVQQSGVHNLYRFRGGAVQPAAGELTAPAASEIGDGLVQVYHGSNGLRIGNSGAGFMSIWIGEFDSDTSAAIFVQSMAAANPSAMLNDPYFGIARDELATSQGLEGLYRVTGAFDGQPYSGNLEVRQQDIYVVAIGFRTLGSALPPVDVTSRVMDHQLGCLAEAVACAPLDVSDLLVAPSATPVVPTSGSGLVTSDEFGWSVRTDSGDWSISEQFAESGYDFVELQSGRSLVTFESVINQHGDPIQCVIDELDALQQFESNAAIDLGSDNPDEVPAGSEQGHAWGIYTVEPLADERADQEYTIRIDCYTLIEGGANLVMTHRAPRALWDVEREKGSDLRETLTLPTAFHPDAIIARTTHDWRCDVIYRPWIDLAA